MSQNNSYLKYILIVIVICLFLYWLYYAIRSYNPYKFSLYTGKKGSGKSSFLACDVVEFAKKKHLIYDSSEKPFHRFKRIKFKIYSNVPINTVETEEYNPLELGISFYPDPYSLVICDEISIYFWNRSYKSMSEDTKVWFTNMRKHRVVFWGYTQTWDIDKCLRKGLVDNVYQVKNFLITWAYARKIDKYQDIKESALDCDSQFAESMQYVPIWMPNAIRFIWIPKYWKYFDTNYIFKKTK